MALFVMVVNIARLEGERDKRCARFYDAFMVIMCKGDGTTVKDAHLPSDPDRL